MAIYATESVAFDAHERSCLPEVICRLGMIRRHFFGRILLTCCALGVWGVPCGVFADDTHYQDYVVGGRAIGLGGAFAAIGSDASGLFYNPAGIADVVHTNVQLSTSLYGFERGSIDRKLGIPVPGAEQLDIEFTELIIVPASAGFVKTIGAPGPDGLPREAYGLSVVVPSYRSFSAGAPVSSGDGLSSEKSIYQRRVTDRELWSGVGYGRKVGKRLRVGISGYYVLRSLLDREDVQVSEEVGPGMEKFQVVTNDISLVTGSLLFVGGVKYKISDGLTAGFSLRAPSIRLHSQGELQFSQATSDPLDAEGPQSSFLSPEIPPAQSNTRHGAAMRLGLAYQRSHKYVFGCDLSYHAPVKYTLVTVADDLRDRLPFNPDIERRQVLNFNVGGEFLVVREVSVAGGFFSDFSSAPRIKADPGADQPPHINLFGLTMALGYFGAHTLSRIGIVYSFGKGHDVIPSGRGDIDRVLNGSQSFKRVAYVQQFFYVFVSSTFRY